jgi:hypothetical protein
MFGYGNELAAAQQLARERAGAKRDDETDEEYRERVAARRPSATGPNTYRPVSKAERRGEFKRGGDA